MLKNLKKFSEFDWSFIFLQNKHAFGNIIWEAFDVNPIDADHRDLKLASGGDRMTIVSE